MEIGTVPPGVDSCIGGDKHSSRCRYSRDGASTVFFGGCSAANKSGDGVGDTNSVSWLKVSCSVDGSCDGYFDDVGWYWRWRRTIPDDETAK